MSELKGALRSPSKEKPDKAKIVPYREIKKEGRNPNMKTRNRLLAALLTLVMILGMLPISAFAEGDFLPGAGATVESADGENEKEDAENAPADDSGALTSGDANSTPKSSAESIPAPSTCTVSFDANGHGVAPAAVIGKRDTIITEPAAPSADGYTFTGWYKDAAATELWDFSANKVTENMTLYAGWSEDVQTAMRGASAAKSAGTYRIIYKDYSDWRPGDEDLSNWPANTTAVSGSVVSLPPVFKSKPVTYGSTKYIATWEWYAVIQNNKNPYVIENNHLGNTGTFVMPEYDVWVCGRWIYDEMKTVNIFIDSAFGFDDVSGDGNYAKNSYATVTATPLAGYYTEWRDRRGGAVISTNNTYRFRVTGDTTLYVEFHRKPSFSITVKGGRANKTTAIEGETVTITAFAPSQGKFFDKWEMDPSTVQIDNENEASTTFTMPASNVTATATYTDACTIYVNTEPEGLFVEGGGVYKKGDEVCLRTYKQYGYQFLGWWGPGEYVGGTNIEPWRHYRYYFTAERDRHFTARFQKEYNVSVVNGSADIILAIDGTTITLTANPPAEGFVFDKWVMDPATVQPDDANASQTTFIMPKNDVTATATYKAPAPTKHTVTYVVANGTWADGTATPKIEEVEDGQSPVQIPTGMIASEGFEGGAWNPDPSGATITGTTTFTYTFTAKQPPTPATKHTVTYVVVNGTWADDTTANKTEEVPDGQTPSQVPTGMKPAENYEGGTWDTDPSSATITGNTTFTYTFTAKQTPPVTDTYTVTVVGGTADKTTAAAGETVTITAEPEEGKGFVQWTSDGIVLDAAGASTTTFTMPAKTVTINANYRDIIIKNIDDQVYTGSEIKPKLGLFDVSLDGVDGIYDLTLTYNNNINAGIATATVTLKQFSGSYVGTKTINFNILPAEIGVTTGSATKAYDGTPLTQADGTITGLVNNETATVNPSGSQTYVGSSENGYAIDWGTAKAGNYTIKTESLGTLTVTTAQQKPTITATAMLYCGGGELDLSSLVSGAAGDVSFDIKSGDAATLSGTKLTPSANATGDVIITVNIAEKDLGGDATPEYSAYTGDGAITVTVVDKEDAGVSITGGDVTKTYGDPAFSLDATAANRGENGVWTWRSSNEAVATVDNDGRVTIVGAGNASITAVYESATTIGEATVTLTVKSSGGGGGGGYTTQYTLTYNTNGGSSIAATKHNSGTTVSLTATPTKEGFTFDGWYSDAALTSKITSIKMDGNKTVYAGWKETGSVTPGHDCPSAHLKDLDINAWYHEYIDYVVEKGLMQGVADDLLAPEVTTSRAMIVTILYRLEGRPAVSGSSPFDDVAEGLWYTDAVKWAEANEIVEGYGNGKFGPNDLITREQFAAIMYRYASFKGYDVSKLADLSGYADASAISDWALAAMQWAAAEGLIAGRTTTTLVPGGNATRAEAAAILMRFIENVK